MRIPRLGKTLLAAVLAVVGGLLITGAASADNKPQPFNVIALATGGDLGNVKPAGASGRFVVKDRPISGFLLTNPADFGTVYGGFDLSFGTNVPIDTQSGQIHGKGTLYLPTRQIAINVTAKSKYAGTCDLVEAPPGYVFEMLVASGTFTFTGGDQGQGDLNATVCFVRESPGGHIAAFTGGIIFLSGQWHP